MSQDSATFSPCGGAAWNPGYGCDLLLPYGSGTVFGALANDTVTWGPYSLPGAPVGLVSVEPGADFDDGVFNGILGLAYPFLAMPLLSYLPGPFDLLLASGVLPAPQFSVYLSSVNNDTSSALILGGTDARYFTGPLHTVPFNPLQPALGYWAVTVTSIAVNGATTNACNDCIGVVDT